MHSFHLAEVPVATGTKALVRGITEVPGLRAAEALAGMELGAPTFSPKRLQVTRLAVFAEWEDPAALDAFLGTPGLGERLRSGWHVRMRFVRRWGSVREFAHLPRESSPTDADEPVVAITLARMKLPEIPRFIRWGRPVERLVRDHPAATLSGAALRPPRTVSTFSVWTSARAMRDMTFGRGTGATAQDHKHAMRERERRDFHREFTTLRFRALSEHGSWRGRGDYLPLSRHDT